MNKPKVYFMVGIPGSGKSTFAKTLLHEEKVDSIHASDDIREELFGTTDAVSKDNHIKVFEILHKRIKEDLLNGKNVVYDATNMSRKRRMSFIESLNKVECEKICVLFVTPYEECMRQNASRDRKVPTEVLKRMRESFNTPYYYEGWDSILIQGREVSKSSEDFLSDSDNFNQDSLHHSLSLGRHCIKTAEIIFELKLEQCDNLQAPVSLLLNIGSMHDLGKLYTKTFKNAKGEDSETAHYYRHENVGAYECFNYNIGVHDEDVLLASVVINNHMQPYSWQRDNNDNEKLHNKYRTLWGKSLYQIIMTLHEADKEAH